MCEECPSLALCMRFGNTVVRILFLEFRKRTRTEIESPGIRRVGSPPGTRLDEGHQALAVTLEALDHVGIEWREALVVSGFGEAVAAGRGPNGV